MMLVHIENANSARLRVLHVHVRIIVIGIATLAPSDGIDRFDSPVVIDLSLSFHFPRIDLVAMSQGGLHSLSTIIKRYYQNCYYYRKIVYLLLNLASKLRLLVSRI